MKKMTKKQYTEEMVELEGFLATVQEETEWAVDRLFFPVTDEVSDYLNNLHDLEYETEIEIKYVEIRFNRRNWTGQDHRFHDLVMQNID